MDIRELIALHQQTLLCVFVTFVLGTIAGFQGLVARLPKEWAMALKTAYGVSYIVARGSLPALLYVTLHRLQLLKTTNRWYEVLLLGVGSETFLRSRFLLVFRPTAEGKAQTEDTKGPLDFVFWFQQFFIEGASSVLARHRVAAVSRYYDKAGLRLEQLVQNVQANAAAVGDQAEAALKIAAMCFADYQSAKAANTQPFDLRVERNWCRKLGYALYEGLSIDNYKVLSNEITK